MFICACVRNSCDGGICCCGVGVPLGLSVLVCCFPAAQHFIGPQGDTGGHMTGPCKAELVSPIVLQQTHPFGVLLSLHCHSTPQHGISPSINPDVPYEFHFISELQSRCTCCHKGKMDISAHLSQQTSVLTCLFTTHQDILCLYHSLTFT